MKDEDKTKEQLIKELKEMRQQVKELELYKYILNQNPVCTIFYDNSEKVIYRNKATKIIDGYDDEELMGLTRREYLARLDIKPGKDKTVVQPPQGLANFQQGIYGFTETTLQKADGTIRPVLLIGSFIYDDRENILGVCGCALDITDYNRKEKMSQILLETIPSPVFFKDANGLYQGCNPAFEEWVGLPEEKIIGRSVHDIWPENAANLFKMMDDELFSRKGPQVYETTIPHSDGAERNVIFYKSTYTTNGYGSVAGLVGLIVDITERKLMEEKLRESEERYRDLFENANDIIYITDLGGNFTDANRAAFETYGYTYNEMLKLKIDDIIDPNYIAIGLANLHKKLSGVKEKTGPYEVLTRTKNGLPVWIEVYTRLVRHKGQPVGIQGVARNISERKQAEKALRDSEALYRTIFENTGTATMISREDTTIALVNTEFELLSGYSKKEIEGKKSWQEFFTAEDCKRMLAYHHERINAPDNPPTKYETSFIDKNGAIKNVLMTVAVIPNTQTLVVSILDITEIKRFQQEIIRLEQLNLIGQMAAGIGHEVRNPMTTVRGYLQLLSAKDKFAEYKEHFGLMIEELDRANTIIKQFLSLAKNKHVEKRNQNINSILKALFPLIQADAFESGKHVELDLNDIPDLLLDKKEIRQLILNLVRNGLEAMDKDQVLTIKTFMDSGKVVFAVKDRGKGISQDIIDRLGTPFLTTKDEGTGLGLAVCYSIAARHNASIDMETSAGGTTFYVRFLVGQAGNN